MKQSAFRLALLTFAASSFFAGNTLPATQTDIAGPTGSGQFGTSVTVLPNGNIIVTDPLYDPPGPVADAGAVYLYNGTTGALISTLTGSTADDQVGSGGVTVLSNGNYVVSSPLWDNVAMVDAGAATWCDERTGCSGAVSSANSLVGTSAGDQISTVTTALTNGNYVTQSVFWDNGAATDAGAVTWCDGTTGCIGVVSSANSLVGSTTDDQVGGAGTTALTNGNYVASSPNWDDGATVDAGAATWCDGTTGSAGLISSSNSLVGSGVSVTNDQVASGGATALTNGNYVVCSPLWEGGNENVGAATWCNGMTGCTGAVSASNSLVGSLNGDNVSSSGVAALTNDNYVVRSPGWRNGAATSAGAATWCDGTTGRTGTVLATNSLVGSTSNDAVGGSGVTVLTNGNYVVSSLGWNKPSPSPASKAGAATWCDGTIGCTGAVSASNSFIGGKASDTVGSGGVVALTNGNYVICTPSWDNSGTGFADVGAATWCNGTTGRTGGITTTNSLVGTLSGQKAGDSGVTALSNGNYVVGSSMFRNTITSSLLAGAATWCNGTTGRTGTVSTSNSLVGSTANDRVSLHGVTTLTNGNYVVGSASWDNGSTVNAGAATWCNGATGRIGAVSGSNSLVGSTNDDAVSSVMALSNGNYVVRALVWDNGGIADAGAITLGRGSNGTTVGSITATNSVRGLFVGGGPGLVFAFDERNEQLVVGRPSENIVSLFTFRGPTLTVTTTDDHTDGNCNAADCTLREAILAANVSSDDNTITFAPGLTGSIQLTGALPDLTSNITLQGPGANRLTVRRNSGGDYRIFTVTNPVSPALEVNVRGITIANGNAPSGGSFGGDGGGIYNDGNAVTLRQTALSGNNAGGIHGGGIYNEHGILTVQNSTLSGNTATMGGGIYNDAVNGASAVLTISNSTLSGNTGNTGGGGIFNSSVNSGTGGVASLSVQSCTLSGNTGNTAGGIYNDASNAGIAIVELANALFRTGVTGANLFNSFGTMISQGNNLSNDSANGDGSTAPGGYLNATGDIRNTDPQLDPVGFTNNGGPTMTIALASGSPAINGGNDLRAPVIDQRGSLRFGLSDIGAFEFGGLPLRVLSIVRLTNGQVTLQGSGRINSLHRIEASTDLNSSGFFNIGTATANGSGALEYRDSTAVGLPKQFYRLSFP